MKMQVNDFDGEKRKRNGKEKENAKGTAYNIAGHPCRCINIYIYTRFIITNKSLFLAYPICDDNLHVRRERARPIPYAFNVVFIYRHDRGARLLLLFFPPIKYGAQISSEKRRWSRFLVDLEEQFISCCWDLLE